MADMDLNNLIINWLKRQLVLVGNVVCLLFNASLWLLLLFRAEPTSESVPLHYSLTFGIDWLGGWAGLFFYPMVGLVLLIINNLLAAYIFSLNKFLAGLLLWLVLFAHLLAWLSVYMLLANYY
jgi:hypothetical protein